MLFASVSQTLIEFGQNPRWLGGEIAASLVLHTWGQTLTQHLHLHCLVAAGALNPGGEWIRPRRGFYAKHPFAGPQQVLDYMGRYTHRVAISNHRLLDCEAGQVRFRYKDYAHGNRRKVMQLEATEFLRRFCLHVLPAGFMRIRHYGILANRAKGEKLARARAALDVPPPPGAPAQAESVEAFWSRVAQRDIRRCPHCENGSLVLIGTLPRVPRGMLRPARPP